MYSANQTCFYNGVHLKLKSKLICWLIFRIEFLFIENMNILLFLVYSNCILKKNYQLFWMKTQIQCISFLNMIYYAFSIFYAFINTTVHSVLNIEYVHLSMLQLVPHPLDNVANIVQIIKFCSPNDDMEYIGF